MKPSFVATAVLLGVVGALSSSGIATAATAYASNRISVFAEPRDQANEIVGVLQAGELVTLDRCTPSGTWCRVLHRGATGWVPASYLIGEAAKNEATPPRSLTDSIFDQHNISGRNRSPYYR